LLDAIRHGTTTIVDHHASPHAVAGSLAAIGQAVKETGLRACLCYEISDRDGARIAKEGLEENAAFIRACRRQPEGPLRALVGLHASFTLSDATLEEAASLGDELQTGFHIHVAEAQADQDAAWQSRANECGALETVRHPRERSIAAHCMHVSRKEMDLLAENAHGGRAQSAVESEQRRSASPMWSSWRSAACSSGSARTR